jgi:hypothetical protein
VPLSEQHIVVFRRNTWAQALLLTSSFFYLVGSMWAGSHTVWVMLRWMLSQPYVDLDGSLLLLAYLLNICLCGWLVWLLVKRQRLARTPILVISRQGIHIGKELILMGEMFIAWNDVEAIYANPFFLCIQPKQPRSYLSQFGFWHRGHMRLRSINTGALINIPQMYMTVPRHEILRQVSSSYAGELRAYNIELEL